ncbi:unnamed protein product [Prorocentrum cordatum]|uniref:Uncharacterized protein n=1 Tax=Prorocentrum cordatum TaxID=2364126 RepID=A0ABN9PFT6_9DINO|nr:unnamed protein product [Polarella glacialis]
MFVRPAVRLVYDLSVSLVHDMACLGAGEQGWMIPPELLVYEDMSRDQKVRYFQELIDRTNRALAETISVETHEDVGLVKLAPGDILGGKNCEETNRLLQLLAYFAISRAAGSNASFMITPQWVTSWRLEYFVEGAGWQWWGAPPGGAADQAELLEGNTDATSIDLVCLAEPVRTRPPSCEYTQSRGMVSYLGFDARSTWRWPPRATCRRGPKAPMRCSTRSAGT